MAKVPSDMRDGSVGWQRLLQVWATDILGILIPGAYFLLLVAVLLAGVAVTANWANWEAVIDLTTRMLLPKVKEVEGGTVSQGPSFFLYLLALITSYIVGYVFYRQSPKAPDSMGFLRSYTRFPEEDRKAWVARPKPPASHATGERTPWQKALDSVAGRVGHFAPILCRLGAHPMCKQGQWACCDVLRPPSGLNPVWRLVRLVEWLVFEAWFLFASPGSCWQVEFPYRGLARYLLARRMPRLAKAVPWREDDHPLNRSKHYINRIKEWIRCELPGEYDTIARNESHVRMVASMWYATRTALHLFLLYALYGFYASAIAGESLWYVGVPLLLIIALGWIKVKIEVFIHYQRVREIVTILCMTEYIEQRHVVRIFREELTDKELGLEALDLISDIGAHEAPLWLKELACVPTAFPSTPPCRRRHGPVGVVLRPPRSRHQHLRPTLKRSSTGGSA